MLEFIPLIIVIVFLVWIVGRSARSNKQEIKPVRRTHGRTNVVPVQRPKARSSLPITPTVALPKVLRGKAYVTDGDGLRIQKQELRLFGIDAPEFDHPWGKKAKWELVKLCKGQEIRAEITDVDDHGRGVAKCYLPDGRDLSEEMVKAGLALDWPKYSDGVYRHFEPAGVRKRLWLADARQKGRMHVWEAYEKRKRAEASEKI